MIQLSENEMDDWLRGGARNQGMRADVEKHVRALVECTWVEGEAAGWLTAIRRARDRPRGRYRPFDPRRGGGSALCMQIALCTRRVRAKAPFLHTQDN